jgi:hypothetical protein
MELLMHAIAMRRPQETVQNGLELAHSWRAAVMAIEGADGPRARWARMRLASRNVMFVSTRFFIALIVVVLVL